VAFVGVTAVPVMAGRGTVFYALLEASKREKTTVLEIRSFILLEFNYIYI
jgi:hypothetical protein